jgi:hypothetical protein
MENRCIVGGALHAKLVEPRSGIEVLIAALHGTKAL